MWGRGGRNELKWFSNAGLFCFWFARYYRAHVSNPISRNVQLSCRRSTAANKVLLPLLCATAPTPRLRRNTITKRDLVSNWCGGNCCFYGRKQFRAGRHEAPDSHLYVYGANFLRPAHLVRALARIYDSRVSPQPSISFSKSFFERDEEGWLAKGLLFENSVHEYSVTGNVDNSGHHDNRG